MGWGSSARQVWARGPSPRGPFCQRRPHDHRSVVLCTLLRADGAAVERVRRRAARWPLVRVVALTDGESAGPLFADGIAVEHLPSPDQVAAHEGLGPWRAYLEGRWAMVRTRWEPVLVLDEGVAVAAWLDLCDAALATARQNRERCDGTMAAA